MSGLSIYRSGRPCLRYLGETDPALVYPADGSAEWFLIIVVAVGFSVPIAIGAITALHECRAARLRPTTGRDGWSEICKIEVRLNPAKSHGG